MLKGGTCCGAVVSVAFEACKELLPSSTVLQPEPALSHFPTAAPREHPTQKRPQALDWLRTRIGDKILCSCEGLFSARVRKVWLLLHAAMLV